MNIDPGINQGRDDDRRPAEGFIVAMLMGLACWAAIAFVLVTLIK